MSIKIFVLLLVLILFAAACAPQAFKRQESQVIPTLATTSTPIASLVAVPEQKDLIFIEFFAGT